MITNCCCILLCWIMLLFSAKTDDINSFNFKDLPQNSPEGSNHGIELEFPIRSSGTNLTVDKQLKRVNRTCRNISQICFWCSASYFNTRNTSLFNFYALNRVSVSRVNLRI